MFCRGQISGYDIFIALVLFIMIFASMRGYWVGNLQKAELSQDYVAMQFKANQAINSLIKTKGYPSNWQQTGSPELIGLAEKANVLSEEKVAAFGQMDYTNSKELLGIGAFDFNFSLAAFNPADNAAIGMPIDTNSSIVSLERSVEYNGGEAVVVFKVFKE